jgi:formate dehydrogenase
MNRHSTLVSYLHKLLVLACGHFGKPGAMFRPSALVPLFGSAGSIKPSPVTGAPIIGGLIPCNVLPDEMLGDHPKRFRGLFVESANPVHSLADSARMRQALAALDLVVVVDVAMTETARLAHYVLPVASQFEKAEATFFNFEFPQNVFHLRRALLAPQHGLFSEAELHCRLVEALGAMPHDTVAALRAAWQQGRGAFKHAFFELSRAEPRLAAMAPAVLYRAIGPLLPAGQAEAAALWGICQLATPRNAESLARAGFTGAPHEAADALFDALLSAKSGVVFAVDEWADCFKRVQTPNQRIQLALPELFEELDALHSEDAPAPSAEFPLVLSAGERRSFTANTIIRNPGWRNKDREGALRLHPDDAAKAGVVHGGRARLHTRGGTAEVHVEVSDRMQPGHCSLPNGQGMDFPAAVGETVFTGVALNELTRGADRDAFAGTPWHKYTPARVEALAGGS